MLVILDIITIRDELKAMEIFPNDPAMHTPLPAIAIFLLLTIYALYVAPHGKRTVVFKYKDQLNSQYRSKI